MDRKVIGVICWSLGWSGRVRSWRGRVILHAIAMIASSTSERVVD